MVVQYIGVLTCEVTELNWNNIQFNLNKAIFNDMKHALAMENYIRS